MTKTEQKNLDKFFRNLRKLQDWEWSIDDDDSIRATVEISTDVNGVKTGVRECQVCPITAVTLATTGREFRDIDYENASKTIDLQLDAKGIANASDMVAYEHDPFEEEHNALRQRILKALNLKERKDDAT